MDQAFWDAWFEEKLEETREVWNQPSPFLQFLAANATRNGECSDFFPEEWDGKA